jgi:maltooligosyltrehalose trehalohydrolase
MAELQELASHGISVVEVMPVSEFTGEYGWGYDGVDLYAPTRLYGEPDDFRRFVDRAHALGIGVILDVVYNHLGPDGCYLREFSKDYFSDRYENEWGDPLNFDGPAAGPVREFFVANAQYWIQEFHLDGLRLDATQQMYDASPKHILAEITQRVREAGGRRLTYIVCENEAQDVRIVGSSEQGGYGADALWNDDFHHAALVALTGQNEAYYGDYAGSPQELVSAAKYGTLYHGQYYTWQKKRRGTPTFHTPPRAFVNYLENHDQVANSARGERLNRLAGPAQVRAMTALLLLGPQTPMLFQGQEFAASTPFLFFADHDEKLAADVRKGRAEFLCQFASIATPEVKSALADPGARDTFERSKLDLTERAKHHEAYALHRDLLGLRRDDPVFWGEARRSVDGALLGPNAFVLRFFSEDGNDRLLLVNLGTTLELHISPEPLLAPPQGRRWRVHWSSESPAYGGRGITQPETSDGWRVPGEAAVVLTPDAA